MKLVVIGGGAAGMAAASKARRQAPESDILVVESGGYVSYAECGIPFLLEGTVKDPMDLLHYSPKEFTERRGIKIKNNTTVKNILPEKKILKLSDGTDEKYDRLVLATGVRARSNEFIDGKRIVGIRSLESGIHARELVNSGRDFIIVGDGILGLELASSLLEAGKNVKIISKHEKVFTKLDSEIRDIVDSKFRSSIEILYQSYVDNIKYSGNRVILNVNGRAFEADGVIYATGVLPNSEIASDAGLQINTDGTVHVDHGMQTSVPDIYAAGDVAQTFNIITGKQDWHPLAQISNKMGRVAGCNAAGGSMSFPGSLGTSLVKLLGFEVGFTGLNRSEIARSGIDYESTFIKAKSRANYFPGSEDVYISINYAKKDGRILGGQIVSRDGGAWRLNTLAMAVFSGLSVEDLFYSDLGYSPPFGPVWDPLIIAASVSMRE